MENKNLTKEQLKINELKKKIKNLEKTNKDQKLIERSLKESLDRYRQIYKLSPDSIIIHDYDMNILDVNNKAVKEFGYSKKEMIKMKVFDLHPKTELKHSTQVLNEIKNKDMLKIEGKFKRKDGTVFLAEASPCNYKLGSKPIIHVAIRDISERRLLDEKIRNRESRYNELVDTINSGVAVYKVINDGKFGCDYIIQEFNKTALELEGLEKKDVIGKSLFDIRPNIDNYGLIPIFQKVWKTGKASFFPAKEYIDNKYSNYYENRIFRLPNGNIVAIFDDVTVRENSILKLKKNKERLDLALNATKDGIYDWNLLTNEIYYSPPLKSILGYKDVELPNQLSVWEKLTAPEDVKRSWKMLNELINKQRDRYELEFKMKHKKGHWVNVLSQANAVFDENNNAVRVIGTITDISKQKRAEEQIANLAKFPSENTNPVMRVSMDGKLIYANKSAENLLFEKYRKIPKNVKKLFPSDYLLNKNREFEIVILSRTFLFSCIFIKKKNYLNIYSTEITERKKSENTLMESHELQKSLLQTIPFGMDIVDEHGNILFMSESLQKQFGAKALGNKCWTLYCDDKLQCDYCPLKVGIKLGKTRVYDVRGVFNGKIFEVSHTGMMFKGKKALLEIFIDITERKRIENLLQESNTRHAEMIEKIGDVIGIIGADGTTKYQSPNVEKWFGWKPKDLIGSKGWDKMHPDDIERIQKEFSKVLKKETPSKVEYRFRCKDGNYKWIELTAVNRINKAAINGVLINYHDITERKQWEEAIAKSNHLLTSVIKQAPFAIQILEGDFNNIHVVIENKESSRIMGEVIQGRTDIDADNSESLSTRFFSIDGKQEIPLSRMPGPRAFQGEVVINEEFLFHHSDGTRIMVEASASPVYSESGQIRAITVIFQDITDRINNEIQQKKYLDEISDLYNNSPTGYHSADKDGFIIRINDTELKWLGYTREELVGKKKISDLISIEGLEAFKANFASFLKHGYLNNLELELTRKDGTILPVILNATSIYDSNNNYAMSRSVVIDNTERKKTEKELQNYRDHLEELVEKRTAELGESHEEIIKERALLRTLIDTLPDQIYIKDNESKFLLVNQNVINSLGKKNLDDIIGKRDSDFLPENIARFSYEQEKEIIKTGNPLIDSIEMVNNENENTKWLSITKVPILNKNGDITGIVGINRNITKLMYAEEILKKEKENAESANIAKSAFLANMSHEIRTPMNAILGFSQLLLRDSNITSKQKEHLGIINRSSEHLLTLINDILEISKIEAGHVKINLSTFDLYELIDEMEMMFRIKTEAKKLQLLIKYPKKLPRFIYTDKSKLRQIFINLIGNAVKFTDNGDIVFRINSEKNKNNQLSITAEIEDSGKGISNIDLDKIFKKFEQTDAGIREGGTGLGLTLSKQFAVLLGGDITVKSNVNKGACFYLRVVVEEGKINHLDKKDVIKNVVSLKPGQKKYKILIADDSIDSRGFLNELLSIIGFEVIEAENGLEAINKFKESQPDLILMDLNMNVMNGYNAIKQIRKIDKGRDIPIIVITASVFNEQKKKAKDFDIDGYILKPFKEQELFELLQKNLKIKYTYKVEEKMNSDLSILNIKNKIKKIPDSFINEMYEATANAELKRLLKIIKEVEKKYPQEALFLSDLASKYQYDLLIKLFKERLGEND